MKVRVGDIDVGYDVTGERGDWVLLIQGLGWARWGWSWQVPELSKHFRVITFDNRGVGETTVTDGPYTVGQMAGDALGLLDALGVEHAHVVGASLGGFVAQTLAIDTPERVRRLVLVCTTCGGPDMYPMPQRTVTLMQEAPSLPDEERLRRFVANGFTAPFVAAHPEVIEKIMGFRRDTAQPLAAWMAQSAAGAAFDEHERVKRIVAPTLVLTAREDAVIDPRNSPPLAAAIPGARLAQMDGGHVFFVENADEFNQRVVAFLTDGAS